MTKFRVAWEIDIEADTPREAAEEALKTQQEKGSEAVYFTVANFDTGETEDVDLLHEE